MCSSVRQFCIIKCEMLSDVFVLLLTFIWDSAANPDLVALVAAIFV